MASTHADGWQGLPTGRCKYCRRHTYGRAATCRRRRCPGYAPIWAGDQRRKLFDNLAAYEGGAVVVLAVTAPGQAELPWDEKHCRALGEHKHSGQLGCRVDRYAASAWNLTASARWRRLHRRVYQRVRRKGVTPRAAGSGVRKTASRCSARPPGYRVQDPAERHAAGFYAAELAALAGQYGFGYTERKVESRSSKRVAGYLSSYFVTGEQEKATLQESVMAGDMPRSIIHVSTTLTTSTGVTMRELRFRRFVWFLAERTSTDLTEAREIATQATAGTLDLTADKFLPSPRLLAQVLGREPPR